MKLVYYRESYWSSLTSVELTSSTSKSCFGARWACSVLFKIFFERNFTTSFLSMLNISANVDKLNELYCRAVLSMKMLREAVWKALYK